MLDAKAPDFGLAEHLPYPFLAMVGQVEMRTALLLAIINPAVNGVLLIGPRGTGKTTAVRSLTGILPAVEVSDCDEGALPADLEYENARYLYPDCYERFHKGESISHYESVRLVELPLNARLEDVVGGINERVAVQRSEVRLERGILARADNNLLYIDEINLLDNQIVDAILDAAAQGMLRSAFGLQGQKCSAGSKVYVAAEIFDAFMENLITRTRAIKIGDPTQADVFMGPVINAAAIARFEAAVADAKRDGTIAHGGNRLTGGLYDHGTYVEPTIVTDLPATHRLHKDELFLPFLTVQKFTRLEDAITDGNAIDFGLTAGIYTTDKADMDLFLDRAEAGALYANRASGATTGAWPGIQTFCGWKGSGVSSKGGLGPYYVQQFMREQSLTLWKA